VEGTILLRYVILRHVTPPDGQRPSHWDFMLEAGEVLRSWALLEPPLEGRSTEAEALDDHRLAYLSYEGPVSGDRGHVTAYDRGDYVLLAEKDDCLVVRLTGERLRCELTMRRDPGDSKRWHFFFGAGSH
jgi:hypothetical protein